MGVYNVLVEGVSGSGRTSVAEELERRGHHVVHGDRQLAYQGDPRTGATTRTATHENHLWDVGLVRQLIADHREPVTFFCGGSRNVSSFVDLFDLVVVLQVDRPTLLRRLDERPADEFGSKPSQRALVLHLHETGEDVPPWGVHIDATAPLATVVDDVLRLVDALPTSG